MRQRGNGSGKWLALSLWLAGIGVAGVPAAGEKVPVRTDSAPPGCVSLPLKVFADRLFIPVVLNGETPCECLIDTGSEATVLNRARVNPKNLRLAGTEQLEGAHVGGMGVERVVLETLGLGDHVLRNVTICAIRHGQGQKLELVGMLIGMDILSRYRFTVDFEHERFLLWTGKGDLPKPAPGQQRARLATGRAPGDEGTRPRVYAAIKGLPRTLFLVDTGAGPLTFTALKSPRDYGLNPDAAPVEVGTIRDGGTPRQLSFYPVSFAQVDFDRMSFREVSGRVLDASAVVSPLLRQELGYLYDIIGTPFLKELTAVHFDMPGRVVYFDRATPGTDGLGPTIAPRKPEPAAPK